MKKLNEAQFLHTKPQTCDNEFHAPIFFALLENTPSRYFSLSSIKDNLPFYQPTHFIVISSLYCVLEEASSPLAIRHGRLFNYVGLILSLVRSLIHDAPRILQAELGTG